MTLKKVTTDNIGYEVVAIRTLKFATPILAGSLGKITGIFDNGCIAVDFGAGEDYMLELGDAVVFTREPNKTIDLDEEDLQALHDRIDNEGFSYCFLFYSHFNEIADKQFHRLRKEYIASHKALEKYLKYGEFTE